MKEKKAVVTKPSVVVAKAAGTNTKFKPKSKEIKETPDDTSTKEKAKRPKKKKKASKGGSSNKEEQVKEVEDNPNDDTPLRGAKRDFSTDLLNYLSQWSHKEEVAGAWKFNKILQNWALEQCFDEISINADLFTRLLPYLASIQGSALDRLLKRAETIIENATNDESTGNDPNTAVSETALKRALKLRTKCVKTNLSNKNP